MLLFIGKNFFKSFSQRRSDQLVLKYFGRKFVTSFRTEAAKDSWGFSVEQRCVSCRNFARWCHPCNILASQYSSFKILPYSTFLAIFSQEIHYAFSCKNPTKGMETKFSGQKIDGILHILNSQWTTHDHWKAICNQNLNDRHPQTAILPSTCSLSINITSVQPGL